MLRFLKRLLRGLLWCVILTLTTLIFINVLVAKYHEKFFSFFNIDKSTVSIGKINSVFLPFFIDVSDAYINLSVIEGKFNSIKVETNLKKIFNSGFLRIKIEGGDIKINLPKEKRKGGVNLAALDIFTVSNLKINSEYNGYKINGLLKQLNLNRTKFDVDLKTVKIYKDDLVDELDIQVSGRLENNKFAVDILNAKGANLFLSLNTLKKQGEKFSGSFKGGVRGKLLKFINKGLNGELTFKGDFINGTFNAVLYTDNLIFRENYLKGEVYLYKKGDDIHFNSASVSFDKYSFLIDGILNYKTDKIKVVFKDIKGATFSFNCESADVKRVEVKGDYKDKVFFIKSDIKFYEDIVFKSKLLLREEIGVEDILILSNSIEVKGEGVLTTENKFKGQFKGNIKDNPYLFKFLKAFHNLNFDLTAVYEKEFFLKGVVRNNAPITYNNIRLEQVLAEFSFGEKVLNLNYVLKSDKGEVKGKGAAKKDANTFSVTFNGSYSFNLKNLNFSNIDYVTGGFDIKYDGNISGIIDADILYKVGQIKVKSVVNNNILILKKIEIGENKYLNIGFLDLRDKKINIQIKNNKFYNKLINLNDIFLNIKGDISSPEILFTSSAYLKSINKQLSIKSVGNLNSLMVRAKNDEFDLYSDISVKEKNFYITLNANQFKYERFDNITGTLLAKSEDFKQIEILGNISGYLDNQYFQIKEINASLKGVSIVKSSFFLNTPQINNVKVYNINFENESITGDVDLHNSAINLDYLQHQDIKGDLKFDYDFKSKEIIVYGKAFLDADLIIPEYGISLRNVSVNFDFNGQQVYGVLNCNYIDMVLTGSYFAETFKDISQGSGYISFNNVFISAANFSGTIKGKLSYFNNTLYGDIIVLKGEYAFKEFKKKGKPKRLPLKIDINIKTENPIKSFSKFSESDLNANLKLRYDNKLFVAGFMEANNNSSLIIGGEKFNIIQGKLTISEEKPPYLYIFARGTNRFKDILLEISGFLPEYSISIRDISHSGAEFGNLKISGEPKANFIRDIFNGEAFGNIISFTNKFFGINNLGIEGGNHNLGYFSIGRTFTDRLTIKYRIKGGEEDNDIVGEYKIFDWLNFNILSKNSGSSGAGITIFYSF